MTARGVFQIVRDYGEDHWRHHLHPGSGAPELTEGAEDWRCSMRLRPNLTEGDAESGGELCGRFVLVASGERTAGVAPSRAPRDYRLSRKRGHDRECPGDGGA